MENWDGAAKTRPAGWSRHPDGYMNTGALALFRPTLKFTDYRMEFFGQIETKSIGWTVRATDAKNYHAMKLTVVEAGIRPFVALVHYNVVDGKSGQRTQTPLNIMVHNNRPMQFAVDVRGNRFVTSIDGEEVDSFIDNTLVAGGVGFFSEAGERARLYWMRVTRNDDWLGHVCAMLAEEAGVECGRIARTGTSRRRAGARIARRPGRNDARGRVDRTAVPGRHPEDTSFSKRGEENHGIRKRKPDQRDAHAARRDGHHRHQEPEARQQDALQGGVPAPGGQARRRRAAPLQGDRRWRKRHGSVRRARTHPIRDARLRSRRSHLRGTLRNRSEAPHGKFQPGRLPRQSQAMERRRGGVPPRLRRRRHALRKPCSAWALR